MGNIAANHADHVLITTDNPRSEDPARIADQVLEGTRLGGKGSSATVERILDRAEAIRAAVSLAAPDDVVVIAGKGHEKAQIMGTRVIPFDDAAVAQEVLGRTVANRTGASAPKHLPLGRNATDDAEGGAGTR
jgi:UDP-N-acetylmuramyl tripeptide synthase